MSSVVSPPGLEGSGPRRPPPLPRTDAARVWAGFVLVVAGMVLIGLGGGALLGVAHVLHEHMHLPRDDARSLLNVLYGVAAACFATAAVVLFLAIRGLCRIMQQRNVADENS